MAEAGALERGDSVTGAASIPPPPARDRGTDARNCGTAIGGGIPVMCTLKEPVTVTIMRDLRAIGGKLVYVMTPFVMTDRDRLVKDWDLWGPLLLCLTLGVVLGFGQDDDQASYVFSQIMMIVWLGSCVVTLNAVLLGGKVGFFQTVCLLGYCIAPLVLAAVSGLALETFIGRRGSVFVARLVMNLVALVWSSNASSGFVVGMVPADRRFLCLYPIYLFYMAIFWLIMLD
eukprot:TRINITY_DN61202_c0_g1_i1.p1 TRINITY_DN61202_c0_g1~~TRINITY_DN61202_c0_g1_i1.p1  ORF type:complete len:230 (-),score=22.89 TRINITY_DN61202_c0_g1_i1:354-1043(-)